MFSQVDYILVNVSDMSRSVTFYRDLLGLPVKLESPGWSEFQTGATTLALHLAGPKPAGERPTQQGPTAGSCSLGFSVKSLDTTYAELQSRGMRFVMPPTAREDEGIRLAVCIDPDGLAISIAERIAE